MPEQRGYSETLRPKKRRDYRLSKLVNDIIILMNNEDIEQAHIVGHDWGGSVAWALAAWHPDRVLTLTVVATPHPKALLKSLLFSKQLFLSWYMLFFQLPYLPEYILAQHNGQLLQSVLQKTGLSKSIATNYINYMLQPKRLRGAIGWYRALSYTLHEIKAINDINVPTLFIYGGKDDFLSSKAAKLTSQWVKNKYESVLLPYASHWLPEESPEITTKLIEKFINSPDAYK